MQTMKQLLFLLVAVCAAMAYTELEYKQMWHEWLATHQKQYSSPEETTQRFQIFRDNVDKIDQLNAQYSPKTKFAMNKFGDLTKEEFKKMYTSPVAANPNWEGTLPQAPLYSEQQIRDLPTSFDWRPKGAVTPVKNQGSCGSCWSFSTTGNIEGQWFLAGNTLVGLSEQNLVDCDHECMQYEGQKVCDAGCDGGLMPNAYEYVIKNGGIDTEKSYPYQGVDGTCNFNKDNIGATISNYTMLSKDEDQMAAYLVQNGPISIAADAEEWQFYFWGVFYLPCGTTLDHGILIVGYDVETDIFGQEMPYWIVKNSWGSDWGYNGYIYLEKGAGKCGCNLFASSSIV